jgi:opacity protein-like surface antigen
MMKKIAFPLIACLALASSAFAGHEMKESKEYKAIPEPCFKDQELQLDIFGSYTDTQGGGYNDGLGGGVAVNYFFMRYLGVGVDGNLFNGDVNGVWDVTGRLIARYPLELNGGSLCLAPYIFGGGGVEMDGTTVGTFHVGGGLEWRATHQIGVFSEGRYTWAGGANDAAQVRVGVRFVF